MLPKDKIKHLKGGAMVLVAVLALDLVLQLLGVHAVPALMFIAGLVAGASVEATQQADNMAARLEGLPPPHEVSVWDLVASAGPCWLAAAVLEFAWWTWGWLPWAG